MDWELSGQTSIYAGSLAVRAPNGTYLKSGKPKVYGLTEINKRSQEFKKGVRQAEDTFFGVLCFLHDYEKS